MDGKNVLPSPQRRGGISVHEEGGCRGLQLHVGDLDALVGLPAERHADVEVEFVGSDGEIAREVAPDRVDAVDVGMRVVDPIHSDVSVTLVVEME